MGKKTPDEIIALTPAQKIQFDVIEALSTPKITAGFTVDITALESYLERRSGEHKVRITLNTVLIKAVALTLRKYPALGLMPRGYRLVKTGSIDIGVSVAGAEILAPVVIVRGAEAKSLEEIAQEVRRMSEQARREEAAHMEKLSHWARWFPFDRLRRLIIRRVLRSQRVRHRAAGNFQISNVSHVGIDWGASPVATSTLLMIGGVDTVPMVVNNQIEIRRVVRLTLVGDHRTLNGRTCGEFVPEMRRILQHPEELFKEGKDGDG